MPDYSAPSPLTQSLPVIEHNHFLSIEHNHFFSNHPSPYLLHKNPLTRDPPTLVRKFAVDCVFQRPFPQIVSARRKAFSDSNNWKLPFRLNNRLLTHNHLLPLLIQSLVLHFISRTSTQQVKSTKTTSHQKQTLRLGGARGRMSQYCACAYVTSTSALSSAQLWLL